MTTSVSWDFTTIQNRQYAIYQQMDGRNMGDIKYIIAKRDNSYLSLLTFNSKKDANKFTAVLLNDYERIPPSFNFQSFVKGRSSSP
jgi:hypothetical protein